MEVFLHLCLSEELYLPISRCEFCGEETTMIQCTTDPLQEDIVFSVMKLPSKSPRDEVDS